MHCALGVAQNVHWGNRPDSIHLVVVVIIDVVVVIVVVVVVSTHQLYLGSSLHIFEPTLHQLPFCKVCNNRKHMEPDYNLSSRCQNFNLNFQDQVVLTGEGTGNFNYFSCIYQSKRF